MMIHFEFTNIKTKKANAMFPPERKWYYYLSFIDFDVISRFDLLFLPLFSERI